MSHEEQEAPDERSSRRRRWGWTLGLVLIVAIACWAYQASGPRYQRRTINQWIELYSSHDENDREMALAAFRAMGGNAVPTLVNMLKAPPPQRPDLFTALVNLIRKGRANSLQQYNWQRERACDLLREIGEPASIPALETASSDRTWYIATSARAALIKIRHEPLTQYIELLKDRSDPNSWYTNAMLLGYCGSNATPAIPLLVESLGDSNQIIQAHALIALGLIRREPKICVPQIIPFLTNSDVALRQKAYFAVRAFKDFAQSASNSIIMGLSDSDPWTRREAVFASREILSPNDQLRALPQLQGLANDPEPFIRDPAVDLVREIQATSAKK